MVVLHCAFDKVLTTHLSSLPHKLSETHIRDVQCRRQLPRLLAQNQILPEELVRNAVQQTLGDEGLDRPRNGVPSRLCRCVMPHRPAQKPLRDHHDAMNTERS